jgi:hypothetical protein
MVRSACYEGEGLLSGCITSTTPFKCRHCNSMLRLNLAIQIISIEEVERAENISTGTRWTKAQEHLLGRWKSTGLMAVWEDALVSAFSQGRPRADKFLFKFLAEAAPIWPAHDVLRMATGTDRPKSVQCWEYAGVTALVINGYLRSFVSTKLLKRGTVGFTLNRTVNSTHHDANRRAYLERRCNTEDGWIKTRFGYVVGRGLLFDEIRGH